MQTYTVSVHNYDEDRTVWKSFEVQARNASHALDRAQEAAFREDFGKEFRGAKWLGRVTVKQHGVPEGQQPVMYGNSEAGFRSEARSSSAKHDADLDALATSVLKD